MSNFVGHAIAGTAVAVAAGCAVFYFRGHIGEASLLGAVSMASAGAFVGSLYPDTDAKSTSGRKICYPLLLLIAGLSYYFSQLPLVALALLMIIVPMLTKHRGWAHTIRFNFFVATFMGALAYIYIPMGYLIAVGYFAGALCHIGIDGIGNKMLQKLAIALVVCLTIALLFLTGAFYGRGS